VAIPGLKSGLFQKTQAKTTPRMPTEKKTGQANLSLFSLFSSFSLFGQKRGEGVEGVMHTGSRPRPKEWKATGDLGTNQSVPAHTRHTGQGWGAQST
jgi:hypothetical protein